jgi:hypothetical protein
MYTEERLFAYLLQFERDFGKSKARIIDATEGGALKRGATAMPLAEAIAEYCQAPLPEFPAEETALRWDLLDSSRESILLRCDEAVEIEEITRKTLPLLEEIRDHQSDQPRVNRAIAKVDEFRARMDVLGRTYEQIMQFSQQSELKRFERDRLLAAAKIEGADKQKRQVERDIENVQAVLAASRAFAKSMTEVADELELQSARRKEAA